MNTTHKGTAELLAGERGSRRQITGEVNGNLFSDIVDRLSDSGRTIAEIFHVDKIQTVTLSIEFEAEVIEAIREVEAAHQEVEQAILAREEHIITAAALVNGIGFSEKDTAAILGLNTGAYNSVVKGRKGATIWGHTAFGKTSLTLAGEEEGDLDSPAQNTLYTLGSWSVKPDGTGFTEDFPCVVRGLSASIQSEYYKMSGLGQPEPEEKGNATSADSECGTEDEENEPLGDADSSTVADSDQQETDGELEAAELADEEEQQHEEPLPDLTDDTVEQF